MSKRRDRLFLDYRNCPRCGSKAIIVIYYKSFLTRKIKRHFIDCHSCGKTTIVKPLD